MRPFSDWLLNSKEHSPGTSTNLDSRRFESLVTTNLQPRTIRCDSPSVLLRTSDCNGFQSRVDLGALRGRSANREITSRRSNLFDPSQDVSISGRIGAGVRGSFSAQPGVAVVYPVRQPGHRG